MSETDTRSVALTDLLGSDAPTVAARVQADGVAYLNVGKGELAAEVTGGPLTGLKAYDPPPEWRKLVDEQCETCGGTGTVGNSFGDCGDCHEGRPRPHDQRVVLHGSSEMQ